MQLTGQQVQQIRDALLAAYSSKASLKMLVRVRMDENLEEVADGEDLRVLVFNLVSWSERTGRVDELIQGAYHETPRNEALQQLIQWWNGLSYRGAEARTQAAAGDGSLQGSSASIDVFLSYTRKDGGAMVQVREVLRGAGLSVWTDEGLVPGTRNWKRTISAAILQTKTFVVLLSPTAKESQWVNNEIGYAEEFGKPIFPVLVAGDGKSAVPIDLINVQRIDGREKLFDAVTTKLLPSLQTHLGVVQPSASPPPAIAAGEIDATRYVTLGLAHYDKGEYDLAIAEYTKAIELDPENAAAYNGRGDAYYGEGELELALADYTQAIKIDPGKRAAYNNRGTAYYDEGEYDLAIADYTQAIKLDPRHAIAYNGRGAAYYRKGELDLAIADYTQAITLDPKYVFAYIGRGTAYHGKGKYDLAIAEYTQAITLDPKYVFAYHGRGNAYHAKGEYDLAIADYTQAIKLDPKYARSYNGRGGAYDGKGEYALAIADYTQALKLNPQYAIAYINRGRAYLAQRALDLANADYAKAKELGKT